MLITSGGYFPFFMNVMTYECKISCFQILSPDHTRNPAHSILRGCLALTHSLPLVRLVRARRGAPEAGFALLLASCMAPTMSSVSSVR